jgi:hypothetical protein
MVFGQISIFRSLRTTAERERNDTKLKIERAGQRSDMTK